mmetsp:Transcript_36921/g.40786  ORF Transcript_36921/g.40786 Transcript_36921/m.40786 type:complete len:115 (+) Transcript_36921:780-1124(+)
MQKILPKTAKSRIATVAGPKNVVKSRATCAASLKISASMKGSILRRPKESCVDRKCTADIIVELKKESSAGWNIGISRFEIDIIFGSIKKPPVMPCFKTRRMHMVEENCSDFMI